MKKITLKTLGLFTVLTFVFFPFYHGSTTINKNTVKVVSLNSAELTNVSMAVAVSGKNAQFGVDDGSTITTGPAVAGTTTTNVVNTNSITVGAI